MLSDEQFTHALTLNTDRDLSAARLRAIFNNFCMNVDRAVHDKQRVRKLPSSDRFLAIAWPENLETNAHLHAVADLRALADMTSDADDLKSRLATIWHQATRQAGSVHCIPRSDEGWAYYMTKKAHLSDPLYWISTEFHPA